MFDNLVQSEQNSDPCAVYKCRGMGPQISSTGAGHHSLPQRRVLPVHASQVNEGGMLHKMVADLLSPVLAF